MSLDDKDPETNEELKDADRREVLASLAKYTAGVAGASAVALSASTSVSLASVSGRNDPPQDPPYDPPIKKVSVGDDD
ncbi:hypothetical protein ROA7450_03112 [Roseovarius albus]|uniref:Uncharacterized protein n=1 Tax=Roseovarius albus TaxID=1247867 RepID=A0A1X6ZS45_9RHOB|nr:hypothetical protein [Roseovarius albus]SLN60013.1 hypothetical protein ROA7450_03112 [Roseovarius albus]